MTTLSDTGVLQVDTATDENLAILQNLLSTSIYSNPIRATLREYVANAADATVRAGRSLDEHPVTVTLPDNDQPLVITDQGEGMTRETIISRFGGYNTSDKREDATTIGKFGVGAMAGYSVADQITVTSTRDGHTTTVLFSSDENGLKQYDVLFHGPSDAQTGTTITLMPRECPRLHQWSVQMQHVTLGWSVQQIQITHPHYVEGPWIHPRTDHLSTTRTDTGHALSVLLDHIVYPIPDSPLADQIIKACEFIDHTAILLQAEPHSMDVAANRETLQLNTLTEQALEKLLQTSLEEITTLRAELTQAHLSALARDRDDTDPVSPKLAIPDKQGLPDRRMKPPMDGTWKGAELTPLTTRLASTKARGRTYEVSLTETAYTTNPPARNHILSISHTEDVDETELKTWIRRWMNHRKDGNRREVERILLHPFDHIGWSADHPLVISVSADQLAQWYEENVAQLRKTQAEARAEARRQAAAGQTPEVDPKTGYTFLSRPSQDPYFRSTKTIDEIKTWITLNPQTPLYMATFTEIARQVQQNSTAMNQLNHRVQLMAHRSPAKAVQELAQHGIEVGILSEDNDAASLIRARAAQELGAMTAYLTPTVENVQFACNLRTLFSADDGSLYEQFEPGPLTDALATIAPHKEPRQARLPASLSSEPSRYGALHRWFKKQLPITLMVSSLFNYHNQLRFRNHAWITRDQYMDLMSCAIDLINQRQHLLGAGTDTPDE